MLAEIGFGALLITLLVALYGIVAALLGVRRNSLAWAESARGAMLLTLPLVSLAVILRHLFLCLPVSLQSIRGRG